MKVEFFHSVLCGHCFIMSDRLRDISKAYPELEIIHRSYPLGWENIATNNSDWKKKWEMANRIDEKHRFNIKGMENANFQIPTARLSMLAIRAGTLAGGDTWDLFDRFQEALYVHNRNIADEEVIAQIIVNAGIDFGTFLNYYEDPQTEAKELEDFKRAEAYGLELIPAMVVEENQTIEGTKRTDLAVKLLKEAAVKEGIQLQNPTSN